MLVAAPETLWLSLLVAFLVDRFAGEPAWLYRHVPHPVVALGRLITRLEGALWHEGQSAWVRLGLGAVCVIVTLGLTTALALPLQLLLGDEIIPAIFVGLIASTLFAQKSLVDHVVAVADGLEHNLEKGRAAVSHIVGRDPQALDVSGVARAAIESAAENQSDAVTAPWFWFVVAGLPGLAAYKAINTLDSMIGYRSERYLHYGRVAARLDDLVNLVPARFSAIVLIAANAKPGEWLAKWQQVRLWAPRHRSPNAGWPEAAFASVLGIKLAGPRLYSSGWVEDDFVGDGKEWLDASDIRASVGVLWRGWTLLLALTLAGLAVALV